MKGFCMNKLSVFDIVLFKIGLIRRKEGSSMFVHDNGMMVMLGDDLPFLDSLILFVAHYLSLKTNEGLDERIIQARTKVLATDIKEFLASKIK